MKSNFSDKLQSGIVEYFVLNVEIFKGKIERVVLVNVQRFDNDYL